MNDESLWPEDVMVRSLADRPGAGTFEAHVTVDAASPEARDHFRHVCDTLGVKPVLIELPAGRTPSQPMTSTYHRGTVQEVASEVAAITRRLRAAGFRITRVKLEAVATNDGVPDTDDEARAFPAVCYFEFHVKLVLPADAGLSDLKAVADRFEARLSRNAFKQFADGRSERFVTLRVFRAGRRTAFDRLADLEQGLAAAGFGVANREREYALFDSHVGLDAGWLDAPPAVPS